jgi:hypothetical protein
MADDTQTRFRPLRIISRLKMTLAWIAGPFLWTGALASVAWLVDRSNAIEFGLAIAAGSFVLGLLVLTLQRQVRLREERRYARRH